VELEDELTAALEEGYKRAGRVVGYWGNYFLRSVRRLGGLAAAKRMLQKTSRGLVGSTKGLDAMLAAGRPDLTMEALVLSDQFRDLFTPEELSVAEGRLAEYQIRASRQLAERERLFPDELEPGREYPEGARRQIRVNAYERNAAARRKCLQHHGYACFVCDFLFEDRYGELGKEFIHVHHLNPLGLRQSAYKLDPVKDLRPVCPNCHAMLHHSEPVLSIEELRAMMSEQEQARGQHR